MHLVSVKFLVLVLCVTAFPTIAKASNTDTNSSEESVADNFASGLKVVYRAYQQCEKVKFGDIFSCLKLRALKFADRVLKSDSIQVVDGINIVKSLPATGDINGRRLNLEPLPDVNEAALPTDQDQKQDKLNEMLVERLTRFFQTHSVQFDVPRFMEKSRQLMDDYTVEEGRRKKNRMGLLLLGGLLKGGMFAVGLKGLALLAGKALIVAKIALVLSAIIGLGKLLSSGHGDEKTTYEIIKHPHISHAHTYSSSFMEGDHGHFDSSGHGHDHYRRSLEVPEAAMYPQLLAYRGQQQSQQA